VGSAGGFGKASLPVGDGWLGAMVSGGLETDRQQLNEVGFPKS